MCNSMLSLKFLVCSKYDSAYSENRDQRMRQVVGYKRLKTIENQKTFRPKKLSRSLTGGGRLLDVPTVRIWLGKFWCFGLGVAYGRRSLTRGGRTWRFYCILIWSRLSISIRHYFTFSLYTK